MRQRPPVDRNELDEVCIIDDAHMPRMITQKLCEKYFEGISVKSFPSVDEAIHYLRQFVKKQRLIFLDLNMPHKDGWHFLENYIPGPKEHVFILSTSEKEEDIRRASNYEFVEEYLRKPITHKVLDAMFSSMTAQ